MDELSAGFIADSSSTASRKLSSIMLLRIASSFETAEVYRYNVRLGKFGLCGKLGLCRFCDIPGTAFIPSPAPKPLGLCRFRDIARETAFIPSPAPKQTVPSSAIRGNPPAILVNLRWIVSAVLAEAGSAGGATGF